CTHPKLDWKLALYDPAANTFRVSDAVVPGKPDVKVCGGLIYDSINQAMILVGGPLRDKEKGLMPTCVYDRVADRWIALDVHDPGKLGGGDGLSVFDPEHNVILGLRGGAYRYKAVPV